jgi:ABC-type sugar transport system permease subunit
MAKKSPLHQQRSRVGIIFATPALVLVSAFLGIPIIQAGYFSFTEWNGIDANWLGVSAYIDEFKNPIF